MFGQNFKDPYFSSYNISFVTFIDPLTELIPGITESASCESLCQLVDYNIIRKRITELIPVITEPASCESLCQLVDYNIIGKRITEPIPGITEPAVCESLCQLVDSCTHWTLDKVDEGCYLVDSPEALEYSDDKISGPRSCDIKLVYRSESRISKIFCHYSSFIII